MNNNKLLLDVIFNGIVTVCKKNKMNETDLEGLLDQNETIEIYKNNNRTLLFELVIVFTKKSRSNYNLDCRSLDNLFKLIMLLLIRSKSDLYNINKNNDSIFHQITRFPNNYFKIILSHLESTFDFKYQNKIKRNIFYYYTRDWTTDEGYENFLTLMNCNYVQKENLNDDPLFLFQLMNQIPEALSMYLNFNKYKIDQFLIILKIMIKKKVNIFVKNENNETILDLICSYQSSIIINYLQLIFFLNELWILENNLFENYIQWLPQELIQSIILLF